MSTLLPSGTRVPNVEATAAMRARRACRSGSGSTGSSAATSATAALTFAGLTGCALPRPFAVSVVGGGSGGGVGSAPAVVGGFAAAAACGSGSCPTVTDVAETRRAMPSRPSSTSPPTISRDARL